MNPKVDEYLNSPGKFRKELKCLREIILDCGLVEDVKWGAPCYTYNKKNVLIIGDLKEFCVLSFFKGALLNDAEGILVQGGENTQSARYLKFKSVQEIKKRERLIKEYIYEALENEKAGLKVKFKKPEEQAVPEEFEKKMKAMPSLKKAFKALTPGRQRAYLLHFAGAKQSKTREARIEACIPQIMRGEGLHDKYM